MKNNIFDKWLAIKDVCEYTGLSSSTLHRAIQKGELKEDQDMKYEIDDFETKIKDIEEDE